MTISACIIACDEAPNLPDCLASVAFCEEILVVDSGSRDATVAIARAAGARVIEHRWEGYAAQRNVGLDNAAGDWVLEVDADERISEPLRTEIEAFVVDPPPGVHLAGLPLREVLVGRRLGPSAKYPKYRHRLLRRGSYRHDEGRTVHEGFIPVGPVHPFDGELVHLLASSWREAWSDCWRYARLEAGQLHARRTPSTIVKGALLRPAAKVVYRVAVDGGWRDGWAGLIKIGLDSATDTIVWSRFALGLRGGERGRSGVEDGDHYGARRSHAGSLHVVAVASRAATATSAARWLRTAAEGGADVALLAPVAALGRVRTRPFGHIGPLTLIRALEAEAQLRSLDAVVPFDRRAALLLRLVPAGLRGHERGISADSDPAALPWDASARRQSISA